MLYKLLPAPHYCATLLWMTYHENLWLAVVGHTVAPYHKDFWIAVATAAPVIALATQISLGQSIDSVRTVSRLANRSPSEIVRNTAENSLKFAMVVYSVSILNIFIQAWVLYYALQSLLVGQDSSPRSPQTMAKIMVAGFGAVILSAVLSPRIGDAAREQTEVAESPNPKRRRGSKS